jgi:hypothetical protein
MQLITDRRGSAAVEFAFVAPLMLLIYYGIAELTQGMMADRRMSHVASAIGDLIAQDTNVTAAEMTDVFNVGNAIMAPFATATLAMRITSVKADAGGTPKVIWSQAKGSLSGLTVGATASIPANMLAANESLIMSEVKYVYASPIKKVLPTDITFNQKFYLKPRKTSEVTYTP